MAQDNNNVRRCGQIGEGEDDELSMVDVLNEQARLQADADAVLGDSDEVNCTYPRGYMKRQALYACATCTPDGAAGVCLACSYDCHEGHDLYELYTKRFFKCDCGNEKFKGNPCKLYKEKKELNARNRYNQNFKGVYCTCSRPYPDPDDAIADEMIQCIICEDWYHGRHLKIKLPDTDDFHEIICSGCMCKYSFLWAYHVESEVTSVKEESSSEPAQTVDVEDTPEVNSASTNCTESVKAESKPQSVCNVSKPQSPDTNGSRLTKVTANGKGEPSEDTGETRVNSDPCTTAKRHRGEEEVEKEEAETKPKKAKLENRECSTSATTDGANSAQDCILKSLRTREVEEPDSATFWPEGWRKKLCRCVQCMDMYKDRGVEFLVDESDTIQAYEERGRSTASASEEESTASALASLDHVQQIEVARGFYDMKTELNSFLHSFAQEGKVVTENDIREFFQRFKEKRRQERYDVPPHSCR